MSNAFKSKQSGLTLTETMLVIAIASMFIVLGIRQFQVYKLDTDLQSVAFNVDKLSEAASLYYYANCGNQFANNTYYPGKLSPLYYSPNPAPSSVALDIPKDLESDGFLSSALAFNPLVNDATASNGYTAQFNQKSYTKQITTCVDPACTTTQQTTIGTVVGWQIQVGVILKDPSKAQVYMNALQATCLSTLAAIKGVSTTTTACSDVANFNNKCQVWRAMQKGDPTFKKKADDIGCPTSAADYNNVLVFERSPSKPIIRQGFKTGVPPSATLFNNYYNTNPILSLTGINHTPEYQYFLCGS